MVKKKQDPAEPVAAAVPSMGFNRDENGYGALPAFKEFAVPTEGFAPGAVVNGNEVAVVQLVQDEAAKDVAAEWLAGDSNVTTWNPTAPEGDGWYVAGIYQDEDEGPFAVFARPAGEKPLEGRAFAEEFLLGSLIKAATKHLKTLAKPWIELKEHEQLRVLGTVNNDCREAVRDAIDIIASNGRLTFTAAVDQVVFKDGVKAVLTLAKTPEAHSLADAEGSYVTIVIEERSKLLQEGDALKVDKDQKPLFDASTEEDDELKAA
jgi:phosphohistidine swiveling domain-containing protein